MPKRGYHHGNLREALIEGCLTLIEKRGPTGFTLSEAAREAGRGHAGLPRGLGPGSPCPRPRGRPA